MVWADLVHRRGLAAWVLCVSMKRWMAFGHTGEDAASQSAPLQLAEPRLDRVEPRRAGRRDVQVNAGMGVQERPNGFGRVGTAVVDDQVQLEVGRRRAIDLREELAELGGAMAPSDPSKHLAGRDVQGRRQIRGPVSLIVAGAALDLPGPQGQHRMGPVERLNLRLLVDREDQRVVGRVEVEPDHIDHLLGELRVVVESEGLEPMWLDGGGLPDLPHLPLGDAGVPSHQPRAPMGGLHRYPFGRQEQDALDGSSGEDRRSPRPGAVHQAGETLGETAAVPQVHGRPTDVQELGGIGGATAGIKGEQDARTTRLPAGRRWSSQPPFQGVPMVRAQLECRGRLHDDHSTKIPLIVQLLYARTTSGACVFMSLRADGFSGTVCRLPSGPGCSRR